MNSIKSVPARVLSRRGGHSLEAEREQFDKSQARTAGGGGGAAGPAAGTVPVLVVVVLPAPGGRGPARSAGHRLEAR